MPADSKASTFSFPSQYHLIIATHDSVLAYDRTGLQRIFHSGSNGVLAAKEARDGSGTLAVADSQTVVLHRIKDGRERSYRLKGSEGQICQLEFALDSKTLFFTTTLLNAVQSYSLAEARLLQPGPVHSSMPTVLSVSPVSHLLLTASEDPPLVYLQNRSLGTKPVLLQPLASSAPVVLATFHPDRPNIFLLAFKDGTVASYDASQISRSNDKETGYPQVVGGEITAFKSLHNLAVQTVVDAENHFIPAAANRRSLRTELSTHIRATGVTGAVWIPGFRSRAITCGADGKCHLVDFEKRIIVRTWHAKGPATALSLILPKPGKRPLVAVGRLDGRIAIFDTSGLLLQNFSIEGVTPSSIIDIEWIKGVVPKVLGDASQIKVTEETWVELYKVEGTLKSRKSRRSTEKDSLGHLENSHFSIGGDGSVTEELSKVDEECVGTVFHRPKDRNTAEEGPHLPAQTYMDLFTPIKSKQSPLSRPAASPRRRSTPRNRPRISSSTFRDRVRTSSAISPSPAYQASDTDATVNISLPPHAMPGGEQSALSPRTKSKPGIRFKRLSNSSSSSASSTMLDDKKKIRNLSLLKGTPGNFSLFTPYMPPPRGLKKTQSHNRRRSYQISGLPVFEALPKEDKAELPAKAQFRGDDDIWLTAESENDDTVDVSTRFRPGLISGESARQLRWPGNRDQSQQRGLGSMTGTSHQLQMTEPSSRMVPMAGISKSIPNDPKPIGIMKQLPATNLAAERGVSPFFEIMTDTCASFQPLYDIESSYGKTSLPPGFAQSFHGPVKVDWYLPRRGSLAFASSPPGSPKRTSALRETSGNERHRSIRGSYSERSCQGCASMQTELEMLRDEVAELKRLVKGKERLDS